jgi:chromosome segregation ATPase
LSDDIGEPVVDLAFIGQALQRLTGEVASLRDDTRVLTAIVQSLDNSHGRLLEEIRAIHRQQSRFGERLRQLEEQR